MKSGRFRQAPDDQSTESTDSISSDCLLGDEMDSARTDWAKGPMSKNDFFMVAIKRPKSDLYRVVCHKTVRKDKASVKEMSDSSFHDYLKGMRADNLPNSNANEMAEYSKQIYEKFPRKTYDLQRHIQFGKDMKRERKLFKARRKQSKVTERWEKRITLKVGRSYSYVMRHIQMYELVKRYPKLQKLCVTFTELFKMRGKIEEVFNRNSAMADDWS